MSRVAIVDFGLGNLFSVQQACTHVGLDAFLASTPAHVDGAAAVILPGVGAFGDAMTVLRRTELDRAIVAAIEGGKLVVGLCLGLQLLFTESEEFGAHRGLGVIEGTVRRLPAGMRTQDGRAAKVPHVGWSDVSVAALPWEGGALAGVESGAAMYFVHSYYVTPADPGVVLSTSTHGDLTFCSSVQLPKAKGNVVAFQFHPERSGPTGLRIYGNIARLVEST